MYYNAEHYPDPTVGEAISHLAQKERQEEMNTGKRFEADWKASVPSGVWYLRLKDSPATFYGGAQEGIRFSADNICDNLLFREPMLALVELKTVGTPSASLTAMFGKYDAEKKRYKKQKHLEDMDKAAQHEGITAVVVINYRSAGHTYAITAAQALRWLNNSATGDGRKSIPESWCAEHGTLVQQRQLKVNWRYDVRGLLDQLEKVGG